MKPMPLGFLIIQWPSKVGLAEYDVLFAYSIVEAKNKSIKGLKMVRGPKRAQIMVH